METKDVMKLKIGDCDAGENMTVGGYLEALLTKLWREGEGFNGKRPFGNSGWKYDVYKPLIREGLVDGVIDEDGYIEEVDYAKADEFIAKLITSIFKA